MITGSLQHVLLRRQHNTHNLEILRRLASAASVQVSAHMSATAKLCFSPSESASATRVHHVGLVKKHVDE